MKPQKHAKRMIAHLGPEKTYMIAKDLSRKVFGELGSFLPNRQWPYWAEVKAHAKKFMITSGAWPKFYSGELANGN